MNRNGRAERSGGHMTAAGKERNGRVEIYRLIIVKIYDIIYQILCLSHPAEPFGSRGSAPKG